jgi:hypothetical protein
MPDLSPTLTNSERKRVADQIWRVIANVEKQTPYWTAEQLKHIAREVEPPEYQRSAA